MVKKLEAKKKQQVASSCLIRKRKATTRRSLAVGPGKFDEKGNRQPMEVKVGDKVLFAKYSGTEVKIEGVEYLILAERDILAVIG